MSGMGRFAILILVLAIIIIFSSLVKIAPHEKGVKERLSRFIGVLEQGWHILIPLIDTVRKVDMRERVINTPPQEMITQDNAVVTVDAVLFTYITEPSKAIYEIQDPFLAVSNLSITTLRAIIGTMSLDEVLGERTKINAKIQLEVSQETTKRGIYIKNIEIQRIDPPQDLMDAMNQQKIAQQEKRAQILRAEGLKEAAIREAEGFKEKQILEADGKSQAMERIAAAKAKALELESTAAIKFFKDNAVVKEQLQVLKDSLQNNSKYILDLDIADYIKNIMTKLKQ